MQINRQPEGFVIAVMVVWNGISYLEKGIQSVLSALSKEDDFLIVDNGSTDGSREYIIENFPNISLLQNEANLGGAGGFNSGAAVALKSEKCKYIWLLDNDIIVESGALSPLVSALNSDEKIAGAGSQICLYNDPNTIQEVGCSYNAWSGHLTRHFADQRRLPKSAPILEADYLAACSVLIRASLIKNEPLFRDFFIFYDDVDWGLRIKKLGFQLCAVPASVILHNYSGLKPKILWREYYRKRNKAICLLLNPPRKAGLIAVGIHLAALNYNIFYHLLSHNSDLYRLNYFAKNDFLKGVTGKRSIFHTDENSSTPLPDQMSEVLIAISNPADAAAAKRAVEKDHPNLKIHNTLNYTLKHSRNYTVAITDASFSIKVLLYAKTLYKYEMGSVKPIEKPIRQFILSPFKAFAALIYASFQLPLDFTRALNLRNRIFKQGTGKVEIRDNK